MRQLSFIFFFAVALLGLMSTTCKDREKNPGRPIDFDTSSNNPPVTKDEGQLTVTVHRGSITGNECSNAQVRLHLTYNDATAGTAILVKQYTGTDGRTVFNWAPGTYYVVADFTLDAVPYTSDSTHVKGWAPPPVSFANGPQMVTINKNLNYNLSTTVDLRE
jgi:hypothetical protein